MIINKNSMIMKRWMFLCLTVVMMATAVQSQTLTLPTKKTARTQVEQEEPKTDKPVTEAPQNAPEMVVPQKDQGNTITLPTTVRRKTAPRAKPIVKRPKVQDNEIYESAEHMPTYPGGATELKKYIDEHLRYPEAALADSVQDIVQVSFIVEKDGSTKDFEVIDEHHPALEAEAVRVLQNMPKWKPATQNGVKVRVEYVVPVKFTLPNQ